MARGLKFRIQEAEELFYLCCKNKGADQLRSHCAADLGFCFFAYAKNQFSYIKANIRSSFHIIIVHFRKLRDKTISFIYPASLQAKGTKSTLFHRRKELSELSILGLRRCLPSSDLCFDFCYPRNAGAPKEYTLCVVEL